MDEKKCAALIKALIDETNAQRLEIEKLKLELRREKEKSVSMEVNQREQR